MALGALLAVLALATVASLFSRPTLAPLRNAVKHLEGANYGVCVLAATLARAWMVAIRCGGVAEHHARCAANLRLLRRGGGRRENSRREDSIFGIAETETGDENVVRETPR